MAMSSCPAFLFGLVLERRFAEHQVFIHNCAIDFSMTAVTMHKRQRLKKPNPVVKMYLDTSSMLECLENFQVIGEPYKRAIGHVSLQTPALLFINT
jgi:hypothetical protein